jgi:hypothetical protein
MAAWWLRPAADVKTLFRELGVLAEVFEADGQCGGVRQHRNQAGEPNGRWFRLHYLHCSSCGSELALGQRKDGGLFPRRNDNNSRPLPDNGWRRWQTKAIQASVSTKPA